MPRRYHIPVFDPDVGRVADTPYSQRSYGETRLRNHLIAREVYSRVVEVVRVNDDATVTLNIDLGFDHSIVKTVALNGVTIPPGGMQAAVDHMNRLLAPGDSLRALFKKTGDDTYEAVLAFDFAPSTVNRELVDAEVVEATEEWTRSENLQV